MCDHLGSPVTTEQYHDKQSFVNAPVRLNTWKIRTNNYFAGGETGKNRIVILTCGIIVDNKYYHIRSFHFYL